MAIGPKAAPRLGELMQPGSSQLVAAAAIFGKVADPDARARAADELIARIQKAGPRALDEQTLQALGLIGGPRATAFLVDQAEHAHDEAAREKALLALGQGHVAVGDTALQAAALRIAGDKKAPGKVRESAFQVLEKMPTAVTGPRRRSCAIADETVRWRAVEAALAAGKDKAVVPVLEGAQSGRQVQGRGPRQLRGPRPGAGWPGGAGAAANGAGLEERGRAQGGGDGGGAVAEAPVNRTSGAEEGLNSGENPRFRPG